MAASSRLKKGERPHIIRHKSRYDVYHHDQITSTQDEAFSQVSSASHEPFWIVADTQKRARGREGRQWRSLEGNLHASLLLTNPCSLRLVAQLGLVAGVALRRAVVDLMQAEGRNTEQLALKWPNDLMLNEAKLAGILIETRSIDDRLAVVIGFGVNCAAAPEGLSYPCATLGLPHARDVLLERLDQAMRAMLGLWNEGKGFEAVRQDWLRHAYRLGQTIELRSSESGVFEGLNEEGHLVLRLGDRQVVKPSAEL